MSWHLPTSSVFFVPKRNVFLPSIFADVGSWREGGGRNLNTPSSPTEMDSRAQAEGGASQGTSTLSAEPDDSTHIVTTDSQREKGEREKLPPSAPAQPKLNGGEKLPAGVPTHFDPAFRSMMPPYVSWFDVLE